MSTVTDLQKSRTWLERQRGVQQELERKSNQFASSLVVLEAQVVDIKEARDIVNSVILLTQEGVKEFIEEVVSLALKTVYGNEMGFSLDYQIKRNQWEAQSYITFGVEKIEPRDCAGGVLDVAAFGTRLALWAIRGQGESSVFILDEPFKFVSPDLQPRVAEMLQSLSELLKVQLIMVSHDDTLISAADVAYRVVQRGGVSSTEKIII